MSAPATGSVLLELPLPPSVRPPQPPRKGSVPAAGRDPATLDTRKRLSSPGGPEASAQAASAGGAQPAAAGPGVSPEQSVACEAPAPRAPEVPERTATSSRDSPAGPRSKSTGPAVRARLRARASFSPSVARSAGLTAAERRRAMGLAPARSSQVLRKGLPSGQVRRSRTAPRPQPRPREPGTAARNDKPTPGDAEPEVAASGAARPQRQTAASQPASALPDDPAGQPGSDEPERAGSPETGPGCATAPEGSPGVQASALEGPRACLAACRRPVLGMERARAAETVPPVATRSAGVGSTELTHLADAGAQATACLSDQATQTGASEKRVSGWGTEAVASWSIPEADVDDNDTAASVVVTQLRAQLAAARELVARSEFEARMLGCGECDGTITLAD